MAAEFDYHVRPEGSSFRKQIKSKLLANDAGEEPPHRMLLPQPASLHQLWHLSI